MSHVGFELPTCRMYNKLAAFTNTADSDPVRSKTLVRCRSCLDMSSFRTCLTCLNLSCNQPEATLSVI